MPVLIEIVILNLILAAAMNTLPDSILLEAARRRSSAHTGDMLKVIASHYVGPIVRRRSARSSSPLLLLSAVNTALADLVSIQFMLSRDKELPHAFGGLNRFGMPVLPLVIAVGGPGGGGADLPRRREAAGSVRHRRRRRDLDQPGDDLDEPRAAAADAASGGSCSS